MQSLWMLVAALLFAMLGVVVKLAAETHSVAEIIFWRGVVGIAGIALLARWQGGSVRTSRPGLHLTRSIAGMSALGLYYYSLGKLPLGTAVTLNYTSAIWVSLLAIAFFGDRARWQLPAALAMGFIGVAFVLRPTLESDQWLPALVGLGGAFSAACAYLNVRKLTAEGEPEFRIVFYFAVFMTLCSAAWMAVEWRMSLAPRGLALMVGGGVIATVAQLAVTRAFGRGRSLFTAVLSYATVPFAVLLGWMIWDERLSALAWSGIAMIVASGVLAAYATARRGPPPQARSRG